MPLPRESEAINSSLFINNRLLPKISDIAFAKMKICIHFSSKCYCIRKEISKIIKHCITTAVKLHFPNTFDN